MTFYTRFSFQDQPPTGVGVPVGTNNKVVEYGSCDIAGRKYFVGDSVYLPSDTYKFAVKSSKKSVAKKPVQRVLPDRADESLYPELYRKSEYIKGSNSDVPKPFQIGNYIVVLIVGHM